MPTSTAYVSRTLLMEIRFIVIYVKCKASESALDPFICCGVHWRSVWLKFRYGLELLSTLPSTSFQRTAQVFVCLPLYGRCGCLFITIGSYRAFSFLISHRKLALIISIFKVQMQLTFLLVYRQHEIQYKVYLFCQETIRKQLYRW